MTPFAPSKSKIPFTPLGANNKSMERLKLLTSKPAAKIIAWLQENPGTSLPYATDISKHANLMWKAGWLERSEEGTKVRWELAKALKNVMLVVGKLEKSKIMSTIKTTKITVLKGTIGDQEAEWMTEKEWKDHREHVEELKASGEYLKPQEFTVHYMPLPGFDDDPGTNSTEPDTFSAIVPKP